MDRFKQFSQHVDKQLLKPRSIAPQDCFLATSYMKKENKGKPWFNDTAGL